MKNCTVWREGKNDDDDDDDDDDDVESMFVLSPLTSTVTEVTSTKWPSLLSHEEWLVLLGLCERIILSFLFNRPSLARMSEPFMPHLVETLARYVGIGWSRLL